MKEKLFAKKSLGQNFLKNPAVIADILTAAEIVPGDMILEIGPGTGALTEALTNKACELGGGTCIIAIEKDHRLLASLRERFKDAIAAGTLILKEGDVLAHTLTDLGITASMQGYKVVANIPYYITGSFFRRFLADETLKPTQIVAMIQKEVAERIVARNAKESLLSLSVKLFGIPELVRTVVRGNFVPIPNVDSAIIAIKKIRNPFTTETDHSTSPATTKNSDASFQSFFFKLLHAGFASKRKMLAGNLRSANIITAITSETSLHSPSSEIITDALVKAGIAISARAEDVRLEQWLELAHILYSLQEGKGV